MKRVVPVTSCPDSPGWIARLVRRVIVDPESSCWLWAGALDHNGYGMFRFRSAEVRRQTGAHRAMWLASNGSIEDGLQVDHLCRVRHCVNPDHLEAVTPKENTRRGHLKGRVGRKPGTHVGCGRHGFTDGHFATYGADSSLRWVCRPCAKERRLRFNAKAKTAPTHP